MKQTSNEILLHNRFIPTVEYINSLEEEKLNKANEKIKYQSLLIDEKNELLSENNKKFHFLKKMGDVLSESLDYNKMTTGFFNELNKFMSVDIFSIIVNEKNAYKNTVISSLSINSKKISEISNQTVKSYQSLFKRDISPESVHIKFSCFPLTQRDIKSKSRNVFLSQKTLAQFSIPLLNSKKELIGIINIYRKNGRFSQSGINTLMSFKNQISQSINNSIEYMKICRLASHDGLTGLLNRRVFDDIIKREYFRAQRYSSDLSLILIDIDHFKKINDSYGHQCGDFILKKISSLIADSIRKTDIIARFGGEEFALLLPQSSAKSAVYSAQRLREKINQTIFTYNEIPIHICVSMGVSSLRISQKRNTNQDTSLNELIKSADKALYKAKNNGRNTVVSCDNISIDCREIW